MDNGNTSAWSTNHGSPLVTNAVIQKNTALPLLPLEAQGLRCKWLASQYDVIMLHTMLNVYIQLRYRM
jgi:hypothetical protein